MCICLTLSKNPLEGNNNSKPRGKFGLPAQYDKSYRINFVIKPPLKDNSKGKGN